MSSSHKKQPADQFLKEGKSCWQYFNCLKVLCDAHGESGTDCWLVPRTHCHNYIQDDYFEKIATCLGCDFFKKKGSRHARGLNHFIAEQLKNYNHKAFEQQFQKEESFLEIFNRIPDGLFTFDRDWRITYFNPAAEELTGFYAEDAVGMYCDDVFKISGGSTVSPLRGAINEGVDIVNQEYELININGRKVPVICSTSSFRNDKGKVVGGLEIFKDITELKKLQEQVVKREKKYRRIFEGGHDMIYISRPDGKIQDVNNAGVEMLGFSSKEEMLALDSAARFFKNPDDRAQLVALLGRDGSAKDIEFDFIRSDGKVVNVLLSSRSYVEPETGEIQYQGIIKDISRRKEVEELVQKRNRELSIVNSIAVAINHTTGLHNILQVTLERVLTVLSLSSGAIFLVDRIEKQTIPGAVVGLRGVQKKIPLALTFKDILLREYLIESESILLPESSFPAFQVQYSTGSEDSLQELSCHLVISKDIPVGFFGFVLPPDRRLDNQQLRLMGSLGNFLGKAIENARMMETITRNRHDLQRLTEKLFQSQEEERRRLARELHDEAGQSLTAVKLGLDHLEQKIPKEDTAVQDILSNTRKMLVRTSSEIRRLAYHLHPTLLTDLGLEPALKLYFKDIRTYSGLDIDFQMVGFDKRLEKDLETALYRFSQEAMTNTLKYSGAESFSLKIIKSYPKLIFMAEDDGVGFDEKLVYNDKRSLGLVGMRERVQLLGGKFFIKGRPGQGARIRIEITMSEDYTNSARRL